MEANLIGEQLAAPFAVGELKFFPLRKSEDGKKAMAAAYIDARAVTRRLDAVLGPNAWQTEFRVIDPIGVAVECKLSIRFDGDWVSRADVGYCNSAADADDSAKEPYKAAYSDALKRAAAQFGIGRYIYDLELERDWVPIDNFGKFTEQPRPRNIAAPPKRPTPAPTNPAPPTEPTPIGAAKSAVPPDALSVGELFKAIAAQLDEDNMAALVQQIWRRFPQAKSAGRLRLEYARDQAGLHAYLTDVLSLGANWRREAAPG